MKLEMTRFLKAVDVYGVEAREHLIAVGFHKNIIYAKAEKAARKGYTDYGLIADRPWLTDKGNAALSVSRRSPMELEE